MTCRHCQNPQVNETTYRLSTVQTRRQWISAALFLATAVYMLFAVVRAIDQGPFPARAALAVVWIPLALLICVRQLTAIFSSVSFDGDTLRWTSSPWARRSFTWSDVTSVEVVKKNSRSNSPDVVRVEHRVRGSFDLPVLVGLQGSWRDPDFEARAAHLVSTWRSAVAPVGVR